MSILKTGCIILLNGLSSSGKSTIINEILKMQKFEILKIDDWFPEILINKATQLGWAKDSGQDPWIYLYEYVFKTTGKWLFNTEVRRHLFDECFDFYQQAKDIAAAGKNVIIDTVLEYEEEYKYFYKFFKNEKTLTVLAYCPIDILIERVRKRNSSDIAAEQRTIFQSFEQFPAMYKLKQNSSDPVVDVVSSATLINSINEAIYELLAAYVPEPYIPKLQEFKNDFIAQFKLNEFEFITLSPRHHYDLILNTNKCNPKEAADCIIKKCRLKINF